MPLPEVIASKELAMYKLHNILVIGSSSREHALTRLVSTSEHRYRLFGYGCHRNPGIMPYCIGYQTGSLHEPNAIAEYACMHSIDLAIVGSEVALQAGVVDALRSAGIPTIGPSQKMAQIADIQFIHHLLKKVHIPEADHSHMPSRFSLGWFSDGKFLVPMPALCLQRLPENRSTEIFTDASAYTEANHSLSFLLCDDLYTAHAITSTLIHALREHFNEPFIGMLQSDFCKTHDGIRLLGFHPQLTIPAAINWLSLLNTDIVLIYKAMLQETLPQMSIQFANYATMSYCLKSNSFDTLVPIEDMSHIERVYFGANGIVTLGMAENLQIAKQQAHNANAQIMTASMQTIED
jgi:hypothetical protein